MDNHTYLMFIDLDEFIIPHEDISLLDLISNIRKEKDTKTVSHEFHFRRLTFCISPFELKYGNVTQKYQAQQLNLACDFKSIVVSRLTAEFEIHFVKTSLQNDTKMTEVDTEVATCHHYRDFCTNNTKEMITTMSRFESQLRVQKSIITNKLLMT